jgi:hypothetical protein
VLGPLLDRCYPVQEAAAGMFSGSAVVHNVNAISVTSRAGQVYVPSYVFPFYITRSPYQPDRFASTRLRAIDLSVGFIWTRVPNLRPRNILKFYKIWILHSFNILMSHLFTASPLKNNLLQLHYQPPARKL